MSTETALPLSTSVTSLQLELSAALEMAVRDRMLVKELALDAARYRWLRNEAHPDREDTGIAVSERDFNDWGNAFTRHYSGEKLDDAIDAALSKVPR